MRIAILCDELPPRPHGGIGTFVRTYAKALAESGHDVAILDVSSDSRLTKIAGVEIVHVPIWPFMRYQMLISRLIAAFVLRNFASRWRPDVVEVPDFGGWVPWQIRRTPIVVRLHTTATVLAPVNGSEVRKITRWFEARTIGQNPNWIAPSKFILERTIHAFAIEPQRSSVVFNPSPDAVFSRETEGLVQVDDDLNYVLYVGHVNKGKGALDLALAMKPLLEERDGLRLVYVGQDTLVEDMLASHRIIDMLGGVARKCIFTGRLRGLEVNTWYEKATVFAFPSRFESFGLVYLEAISAGLPVVASNRSAEREFLVDGETAFLVDPDDHDTLASRIRCLLDDPARGRAMAMEAKRRVLPLCSVTECVRKSVQFYEEVLSCQRD